MPTTPLKVPDSLMQPMDAGRRNTRVEALKREGRHPVPIKDMTVKEGFARVGANEWAPLRTRFRTPMAEAAE